MTAGHCTSLILLLGHALVVAIQALAGGTGAAAVQAGEAGQKLFPRLGQRLVGGAHVGEHGAALLRGHLLRVQHGQQRQRVLEGRIGVPVGGALDAVPVDLARLLHVGQPGDFRTLGVAILDQRVGTRRAEAAAEGGELGRAQVLVPEHQHRMLGKGPWIQAKVPSSSGFDRSIPRASVPSAGPRGRSCGACVMADPPWLPTIMSRRSGRLKGHDPERRRPFRPARPPVRDQPGWFQPHQAHTAWPMTRSLSRPDSQGSSSVNIVTHCRQEHGIFVMSVPQNMRAGPNAS